MFELDPLRVVIYTVTAVLAITAVVARRIQDPGPRLTFFLRTAKDAAVVLTVATVLIQMRN